MCACVHVRGKGGKLYILPGIGQKASCALGDSRPKSHLQPRELWFTIHTFVLDVLYMLREIKVHVHCRAFVTYMYKYIYMCTCSLVPLTSSSLHGNPNRQE